MVELDRLLPILVQFGIGALLCVVGLWSGYRSGYLSHRYREDRALVWTIAAGFVLLLLVSLLFTFVLPQAPEFSAGAGS